MPRNFTTFLLLIDVLYSLGRSESLRIEHWDPESIKRSKCLFFKIIFTVGISSGGFERFILYDFRYVRVYSLSADFSGLPVRSKILGAQRGFPITIIDEPEWCIGLMSVLENDRTHMSDFVYCRMMWVTHYFRGQNFDLRLFDKDVCYYCCNKLFY